MPSVLLEMIERLRRWGIVRNGAEPDSAIVNIYEAVSGDSNCFFLFFDELTEYFTILMY